MRPWEGGKEGRREGDKGREGGRDGRRRENQFKEWRCIYLLEVTS